jgi:hypothetical protein
VSYPLRVWAGEWAICRLAPDAAVPAWADPPSRSVATPRERAQWLVVVARTGAELSIVAPVSVVPTGAQSESGFRVIEVVGPVPFLVTGLMASIAGPLAAVGISLFPVATYDTDYVLVKDSALSRAVAALSAAGFEVS